MFVLPINTLSRHSQRHSQHQASEFSRRLESMFHADADQAMTLRSPALDVSETATAYTLQLDMPGVSKEAIKISIEGRRVSIDAEQAKPAPAPTNADASQPPAPAAQLLYRERALTRYSRSVSLPQEVNQADSNAKLENGVLTLTLVKRQAAGASHLTVS
ncbi:Hsp20/alpha crystallin family protein [Paucibacter sp. KCTC 42545]|uniref:Hsp20/alpha crystallin family protein n=1 Tax=Paucibacter sp. KCTC 42545 TaxID=1768242 RepID=UPI000733AB90|nr:Hsp20/alpha crystallin family protein [Paucibacter sp. KCTC 42545]ALT77079.1 hypothetical protein AT984_07625 [Paucibacter sp. KCTC 42545]